MTRDATARPRPWPWLSLVTIVAATIVALRWLDRPWWCACGGLGPISMDAFGEHNSQHFFDPYSLTHLLKGLIYCGITYWAKPRLPWTWGLCIAIGLEAGWELAENSPFVIERYRTHTVARGYQGDTVANSLGDILSSGAGFLLARRLGVWPSVALYAVTEAVLLCWIRDSLTLTVIMLIYPIEAIKTWQTANG